MEKNAIQRGNNAEDKFLYELLSLKDQILFKEKFKVDRNPSNIVIAGMGGSGIAGRLFQEIYSDMPVFISNGYSLPKFVGKDSIVVCISYSGNTEETISAYEEATRKNAQLAVITSGGELLSKGRNVVKIPSGTSPRSALGYMLMPLLNTFYEIPEEDILEARAILSKLDKDNSKEKKIAAEIFEGEHIPIVYSTSPNDSIAYRWNTQLNENSKILALWSSFPELNHNNTMALKNTYRKELFYPICIKSNADERISARITATEKVTNMKFRRIIEAEGTSPFAKLTYLLHVGDYISYHLAKLRNMDPLDITSIEELKSMIKKPT